MNFKRSFIIALTIICIICLTGCTNQTSKNIVNNKLTVAVSIVPQKTFVEAIAGDLADVVVMIPPGHSPANYQPSPREMEMFSSASLYFSIGVPTEKANILPKAKDFNSDLKIISLEDRVDEAYPPRYFNAANGKRDPHIWLSPRRVKIMAKVIGKELGEIDPGNKETYQRNTQAYIEKLDTLDQEIKNILSGAKKQAFIVYHPTLGYFADDYNLEMIAVEKSGKEATAKELQKIIDIAREKGIKVVFYQAEIDSTQSKTLADEIRGTTEQIEPLAPDYIENLRKIAQAFRKALK